MTEITVVREDEKATAILKAIRQIDDGAELVPVVRCRDCKHCNIASWGELFCGRKYTEILDLREDDFCSYGERRADDGKAD